MSKVIKATGYRPLSHVVQTDQGKYYMVDSNDTVDQSYETMAFEWDEKKNKVKNWIEQFQMLHVTQKAMEKKHKDICENLEKYMYGIEDE